MSSISFIVSACDHPELLPACLACLRPQADEIIVCDNGLTDEARAELPHWVHIVYTGAQGAKNCYEAANMVMSHHIAQGDWLCFPSDDSLYVARFAEIMLETAALSPSAGLIHCSCIYAKGTNLTGWNNYTVLESAPIMGRIDKTNFIVRRELFKGFPPHPKGWCDGALVEQLVAQGVKCAKAPGVLVVHQ